MRVDTLGSPAGIRRPVQNQHVPLDIDIDIDEDVDSSNRKQNTGTKSSNKVAKPPRPDSKPSQVVNAPPQPPPPPPAKRVKSAADYESKDVEMANVASDNTPISSKDPKEKDGEADSKAAKSRVASEKEKSERQRSVKREASSKPGSTATPAATARDSKKEEPTKNRFTGTNLVQYGLWAHYLAYGSAMMCLCMGAFAIAWVEGHTYHCRINGELINSNFLYTSTGSVG